MKLHEKIEELISQTSSLLDRMTALEAEVAELKESRTNTGTTKPANNTVRPSVFYRLLMVPKTGIQPQGKTLAKVLSEIPATDILEDGLIPHAVALAAVEANFERFKSVQTPRRMLNYYSNELHKKQMLEIVEK